ncbi:MAG TPA: hypothetical protein VF768_11710 [Holophagaceae bacterium]
MNNPRRKKVRQIREELDGLRSRLEELVQEEQGAYDAMPEGLQSSEKGEKAAEAVSALEDALSNVETAVDDLERAVE